jgi:hypothetical protein
MFGLMLRGRLDEEVARATAAPGANGQSEEPTPDAVPSSGGLTN